MNDKLRPAKGIANGMIIGLFMWAIIGILLWLIFG